MIRPLRTGLPLLLLLTACARIAGQDVRPAAELDAALRGYRDGLGELRRQCQVRALPPAPFFLFGMGDRRKLLFARGELSDARTGELLRRWDVVRDWILPAEYSVVLETRDGQQVAIVEDEEAVWLRRGSVRERITGSSSGIRVTLPSFSGHPRAAVLRVLHQEILWNIVDGKPLPNAFVYSRPWYRDGAMVAMVLARTGNLALIKGWILGLREPFDRNNAGEAEADNPGEVLYLISLVSDRSHPLVPAVLEQLKRLEKDGHIEGRSDFAPHAVYQTNWARLGLTSLGLPCHYEVPKLDDSYARLCWWAQPRVERGPGESGISLDYPYLTWAEAHFDHRVSGPISNLDYPLSWEARASQADYTGMGRVDARFAASRVCVPHTWHAAEMFLAVFDQQGPAPARPVGGP